MTVHGHVTIPDDAYVIRDDAGEIISWVVAYPPLDPDTPPADPVAWGWTPLGYTTEGEALRKPERPAPQVMACIYCARGH